MSFASTPREATASCPVATFVLARAVRRSFCEERNWARRRARSAARRSLQRCACICKVSLITEIKKQAEACDGRSTHVDTFSSHPAYYTYALPIMVHANGRALSPTDIGTL